MSIISRYILSAHIGPFLFGSVTVMFLFLLQFLYKFVDQLVGKGLGLWIIVQLIGLNLAWMVVLAVPMGVLVATLMAFGNMSGANEVTIIKSGGGSLIRMMMPVSAAAIAIFILLFLFNDKVLPDANHQAKILLHDIQRKKPTFAIQQGQFSSAIEGYSILSRSIDSVDGSMHGVTIYDKTNANERSIISADSGFVAFSSDMGHLIVSLYHGEIHQSKTMDPNEFRRINFERHRVVMQTKGFEFTRSESDVFSRGDREMRVADMQARVDENIKKQNSIDSSINAQMQKHFDFLFTEGPDSVVRRSSNFAENLTRQEAAGRAEKRLRVIRSTLEADIAMLAQESREENRLLVEIHKKYAIPFACVVFMLVGCPLGIITKKGNFGISAAITLGFYIVYWAGLIGGEKLADRGLISPIFMWFANVLIGVTGIILTLRVSNENMSFGFLRRGRRKAQRDG